MMKLNRTRNFETNWKRIPLSYVMLATGIALAASAAITVGTVDRETARINRPTAVEKPWATGEDSPALVYYIVGTDLEGIALEAAISSEDGTYGAEEPSSLARIIRMVATAEDDERLFHEFVALSQEGTEYSIVDTR